MHLDPELIPVVGALLVILAVGAALRRLNQPNVIGYLIAGIMMGPFAMGVIDDQEQVARLGEVGVMLLLFFVGMKISPRELLLNWRISVVGTLFQICASLGLMAIIGLWQGWDLPRIVVLGFVISLSSTAVVLNYLQDNEELDTKAGKDTLSVLLAQDILVIAMLVIIAYMGGGNVPVSTLLLQTVGAVLAIGFIVFLAIKPRIHLPFALTLFRDHEMQVFFALLICFGFALVSGLLHLSTALGAFMAGMLVGAAPETNWIQARLEPFRVVFVALFFVSIGMLVDLGFIADNASRIALILVAVFLTNTFINMLMLLLLGESWRHSLYAGSILAQIGEFSFVLAAVAVQSGLVQFYTYQITVTVIALSLLLSPAWIGLAQRVIREAPVAVKS